MTQSWQFEQLKKEKAILADKKGCRQIAIDAVYRLNEEIQSLEHRVERLEAALKENK